MSAFKTEVAQRAYGLRKDAKNAPPGGRRADDQNTHLLPEVRAYRAGVLRCLKTIPAFLSGQRDVLLQACARIALSSEPGADSTPAPKTMLPHSPVTQAEGPSLALVLRVPPAQIHRR